MSRHISNVVFAVESESEVRKIVARHFIWLLVIRRTCQYLGISNGAGLSIFRSELMLTKNFLQISFKHDPRSPHTNFEQKRTADRGETSILVRFGNFFTFSWKNQPKVGFEWFCSCVQKIITFDSEKLFPSGLKHWINGNVNFEDKKIGSKKRHGILF